MSGKTTIEWTHAPGYEGGVWNPTTGCTRVSDGCDNCYAFALHDKRFKGQSAAAEIFFRSNDNAVRPERLTDVPAAARAQGAALPLPKQYDLPFSRVQLLEDRLDVPLRTKKPTCYFVDSMADLFHEDVPEEFIDQVFFSMMLCPRHRFLILTKRPERMRSYIESRTPIGPVVDQRGMDERVRFIDGESLGKILAGQSAYPWPAPNVWLGTSVEDQKAADERIAHLLATPATVRFLSCEPLLGPITLPHVAAEGHSGYGRIDWVIVGGESGPRARPMDLAWVRGLRDQCQDAGVAVFVKQLGSKPVQRADLNPFERGDPFVAPGYWRPVLRESHGRDMAEWPEDLRVREWPR